jgi:hypothetical protein
MDRFARTDVGSAAVTGDYAPSGETIHQNKKLSKKLAWSIYFLRTPSYGSAVMP